MCEADKHLSAKCTDCWMVQAVLGGGGHAAHRQAPQRNGKKEYQSNLDIHP